MLLDDSVELEHDDPPACAKPLKVNWEIDLSKIWIPSNILPNRKKQINPNENKPFILYTLEKADYSKTFSIYDEDCPQYHESQTSSVPPRISPHKLINNYNDNHEIQQALPSSENAFEWEGKLDAGSENVVSPNHLVNNNQDDSLRDCHETYNSVLRNAPQWEKKALNTYSVQGDSYRASLEDLKRRMAEILSEDEPLKENWHHEDVIKTSQITTGTLDSIPPSTKDSLEELYYSDDDDNQFAVEYELDNLELESPEKKQTFSIYTDSSYVQKQPYESFVNVLEQDKKDENQFAVEYKLHNQELESPEKKPTCSIYTEKSYVPEQSFESFLNDLKHGRNSSDKCVPQSCEIQFENQKEAVDNAYNQSELNGIEFVVHTKDSKQKLLNYEGKSEDLSEKVPENFPIAYKRPSLQAQTNKTKPQKERKKSKKAKKYIPLADLFQSEKGDRFKVPEVDEFYENLVRQGKCKPHDHDINFSVFPSVNFTEQKTNVDQPDQLQNLSCGSAQFGHNLSNEKQSNSPDEIIRNEEKIGPELDIIVVDNIPLCVSKENIESFILGFGELKNLTFERDGIFQRAKLQMDSNCDIDWIIECLNDTQPFGSSDKELIKCYRQIMSRKKDRTIAN